MTSPPPLSVLMPVHDAAAYLPEALASILAQSHRDFELLVIDDGSTDGSAAILASCRDPRLRVLTHPRNLGLTASLNEGLREARGGLIARQDADDVSHPRRLELQLRFLEAHPQVALLGAQARAIDEAGRPLGALRKACEDASLRWELLFENGFIHSAVMFRSAVVRDQLGGYDAAYRYCQDAELWSRLMRSHQAANLDETLVDNRVHRRSMTLGSLEGNRSESRRVIGANLRAEFGPALGDEDVLLALELREGLPTQRAPAFLLLYERLLELFTARRPGLRGSRDFRRSVARQYARLLLAARLGSPGLSARVLLSNLPSYPVLGATLAALRDSLRARRAAARS